jgi:hypothetical protein
MMQHPMWDPSAHAATLKVTAFQTPPPGDSAKFRNLFENTETLIPPINITTTITTNPNPY